MTSFIVFSVVILVAMALLAVAAWKIRQRARRFWGTAQLARALVEVGALNLVIASPLIVADVLLLLGLAPNPIALADTVSELFATLSPGLASLLLPLWMTLRLRPLDAMNLRQVGGYYVRVAFGFFLVTLATSLINYAVLPLPIRATLTPAATASLLGDIWLAPVGQTIAATVLLVVMRSIVEMIRVQPSLPEEIKPLGGLSPGYKKMYWLLAGAGLFGIILWGVSVLLYFYFPNEAYIPPGYLAQKLGGFPFTLPTPLERTALQMILLTLSSVLLLLIGLVFALLIQPKEPAALLFAVVCVLYGLNGIEIFPAVVGPWLYAIVLLARVFVTPAQIHFALIFPREQFTMGAEPSRWKRWLVYGFYILYGIAAPFWLWFFVFQVEITEQMQRAFATTPDPTAPTDPALLWEIVASLFWGLMSAVFALLTAFGWLISGLFLLRTWLNMRTLRARLDTSEIQQPTSKLQVELARAQQQLKWVGLGGGLFGVLMLCWFFLGGPLLVTSIGAWVDVLLRMLLLIPALFTFIAIVGYRLWDVDILIRNGLTYGLLTVILIAVYAVIAAFLSNVLGSSSLVASLIAALAIAFAIIPLRDKLQEWIDRVFYRQRLKFRRELSDLGQMISATIEMATLRPLLIETIPQRLQLTEARLIETNERDAPRMIQELRGAGMTLVLPLRVGAETLGLYGIGPKRAGIPLNSEERELMTALSYEMATALANVRSTMKLGEEYKLREQIHAQLHAEVGSELGGVKVLVDKLEGWVKSPTDQVQDWFVGIQNGLYASIMELRGVYARLGTEAAELSLVERLEQVTARYARTDKFRAQVMIHGSAYPLDQAAERTLVSIVKEALYNVFKYADAEQVRVELTFDVHAVRLAVRDDGKGFQPEPRAPGIGLKSMRVQAEQMGGTFQLHSAPGRGTRIEVIIPTGGDEHEDQDLDR